MRLFLIRHGESESNAHWDKVVKGSQLNAHLTKKGVEQSRKLTTWMAEKIPQVDVLYTSSLHRTIETAEPIAKHYQIEPVVDHRLREGGYNFKSGDPIEDDLLPLHKLVNFHADPFAPFAAQPPGVESFNDLRTRVGNFISDLIDNHQDQTVVVVMHGWVLNAFLDHVFNVGSYRSAYLFAENTSITYLEYFHPNRIGPWWVYFVAQTPHLEVLPDGLVTLKVEA